MEQRNNENGIQFSMDATVVENKDFGSNFDIKVINNAKVVFKGNVKLGDNCNIIIESGSIEFQKKLEIGSALSIYVENGSTFQTNGIVTFNDYSNIELRGAKFIAWNAFLLKNHIKMIIENSTAHFMSTATFGDESIIELKNSELKIEPDYVLTLGKKSTLDARYGQLIVKDAKVFLGDRSILELMDYPVS